MKKNYLKNFLLAAITFVLIGSTSCSDDDKTNDDKTNNDKTNNDKTNNDKTNDDKTNEVILLSVYQTSHFKTQLNYDSQNRLIKLIEVEVDGDASDPSITDIEYNNDGKIVQLKFTYDKQSNNLESIYKYTYVGDTIFSNNGSNSSDTLLVINNLLQCKLTKFSVTDYKYDSNGNLLQEKRVSRNSSYIDIQEEFYSYNMSEKGLLFDAILPSWLNIGTEYIDIQGFMTNLCTGYKYQNTRIENGVEVPWINDEVKFTYEYDANDSPIKLISKLVDEEEEDVILLEYYPSK